MNSHLTKKQQQELRSMLEQEKASLEKQLQSNEHFGLRQENSTGELSTYDNHPADIGTEQFERSKDLALEEHAAHRLDDLKAAMQRLNEGHYGTCEVCQQPISYERLKAVPTATLCIEHAQQSELDRERHEQNVKTDARPIEESFLQPPFGRSSKDEEDFTGFDGEDAWQIVESWGSSNSPAMAEEPDVNDYNGMYIEAGEHDGYVEKFENFIGTDIYGENVTVYRTPEYKRYMDQGEGDRLLEPDMDAEQLAEDDLS